MTDLSRTAQELQRRKVECATNAYSKSVTKPRSGYCERDMFDAVLRALGKILTEDLKRRNQAPKIDPRNL